MLGSFLAGSVVRGEETPTSDLDIVIITSGDKGAPYRESFRAFGWPIEAFIHTAESYRDFFASDAKRRRPSLPMMCAEGIILRDQDGQAIRIKEEARGLIDAGPEPLSAAETNNLRYAITDILDDLLGSQRHDESLFIAYDLAVTATELILSYHQQWLGRGKWVNAHELGIEALVVIGGDGSLNIAKELSDIGMPIVGVPKTIDNDLSATDATFGFDTALTTATEAIDKLHTTAESHHRVMVLEVMGRYAGWIALQAGMAGGADVILIPEIPFRIEKVAEKIRERKAGGKKFSIVVVAEGATPEGGEMVVRKTIADSPDPIRLGGIGQVVGNHLEELTGMETRVTVLGHLQRGGSPTAYDRILGTRYGVGAVRLVAEGGFTRMVALKGTRVESVTLAEAVGELRRVPPDGELVAAAKAVGVSFGS